jgi:hypothetical protein
MDNSHALQIVLDSVIDVVKAWGSESNPILDSIETGYRKRISAGLGYVAGESHLRSLSQADDQDVAALLLQASDSTLESLISSPAIAARCFWETQRFGLSAASKYISDSIQVLQFNQLASGWFPNGECLVLDGLLKYTSPKVDGIVIDTLSPDRLELFSPGDWTNQPPESIPFQDSSLSLVSTAMGLLKEYVPEAYGFVRLHACVIVPRSAAESGSSSTISFPGRVVLDIPSKGLSCGEVAESLVHEALHSLLYKVEAHYEWFSEATGWSKRLTSPWTGNSISLHAYAHACIVWYALCGLWIRMINIDQDVLGFCPKERLWSAVKGFVNNAEQHLVPEACIASPVVETCIRVSSEIREMYS